MQGSGISSRLYLNRSSNESDFIKSREQTSHVRACKSQTRPPRAQACMQILENRAMPLTEQFSHHDSSRTKSLFLHLFFCTNQCGKKPQRVLTYIKHNYSLAQFENTFHLCWQWLLYKDRDISQPEILRELLSSPDAGFSAAQVGEILTAATTEKKWKEELTAKTKEALERGAFGAPFFWVVKTADDGQNVVAEEPFFGSDR